MTLDQEITILDHDGEPRVVSLREIMFMRGTDLYVRMQEWGFSQDFKDPDFENILQRMLMRVPDTLDKREGSIIYDALAPAAVEFTEAYIEREGNRALSYASTSVGQWLDMRVAEHGVFRMPAVKAVRYGWFWADNEKNTPYQNIAVGGAYSIPNSDINFIAAKKVAAGVYEMTCEQAGDIGNQIREGTELLPVVYMPGLAVATLEATVTPGENEESDDALYRRFIWYITRPPFGGNRSDYEEYFRQIDGVGYVRLYRADPDKGHVTAYILGSDEMPPSAALIQKAQTLIDPFVNQGEGVGLAPMAHIVHVYGSKGKTMNINAKIVLIRGWTIGQVQSGIEQAIDEYLLHLREHWADYVALDSPEYVDVIVRIAQLEAAILTVEGVADIAQSTVNGINQNMTMNRDEVPLLGTVTLTT